MNEPALLFSKTLRTRSMCQKVAPLLACCFILAGITSCKQLTTRQTDFWKGKKSRPAPAKVEEKAPKPPEPEGLARWGSDSFTQTNVKIVNDSTLRSEKQRQAAEAAKQANAKKK